MFNLLAPRPHEHPALGPLHWRGGYWRTSVVLAGRGPTPLILAGTRKKPDEAAIAEALVLPILLAAQGRQIADALFEHFEPYAEALADGMPIAQDGEFPKIHDAEGALDQSALVAVLVEPLGGLMTVELCFTTTWDPEHTIGVRFQGGKWLELCGSTLVP